MNRHQNILREMLYNDTDQSNTAYRNLSDSEWAAINAAIGWANKLELIGKGGK